MVPPEFLRQAEFLHTLRLEEKRCQRSGVAFGLVKIEAPQLFGNPTEKVACERLTDELRRSLRDTDQCGWYAAGKTMGVIFIELQPESALAISESLMKDLRARLGGALPDAMKLQFSVACFPEGEARQSKCEKVPKVVGRR